MFVLMDEDLAIVFDLGDSQPALRKSSTHESVRHADHNTIWSRAKRKRKFGYNASALGPPDCVRVKFTGEK